MIEKIKKLKEEKNAVILVHNYQKPEIYEVADFIGDSLKLCEEAASTDADIIVFCGVHFMAESAYILNPGKKVLMPHIDAGCPMADMVNVKSLREFKARHEGAAVVTYVNSSAEVKAESDYCCTSANAEEVVKRIPEEDVIFVPDKNLAFYVQRQVPEKNIIPWDGFCPVHQVLTKEYLKEKLKDFPECKIIAHPECRSEILDMADHIASTSGMIDCARKDEAKDFFILTECGMVERLKRELPEKNFHSFCNICFDMKKNSLESVYKCLRDEKPVVKVDPEVAKKAKLAFDRMFDLFK